MNNKVTTVTILAVLAAISAQFTVARSPNVIVIFSDDQGWADSGCYGADDIETPYIDALAEGGVRFEQFCAAAPVCSPSRAGLLTGRYPLRAGVPSNVGKQGLPTTEITMAELFKDAGYATGHVGKWHLGSAPDERPRGQGFDTSFGHMVGCIDNYSHFFYWNGPNRHDLWHNGKEVHRPGEYFPDLMVEYGIDFIDRHAEEPFFLYFASNAPHYPYQGTPEWLERYQDVAYPRNLYGAFLSSLDERIGVLLGHLDEKGLTDNTIVVFQSDHGYSTEERAHFGGGSAGPFRGAKFSLFEGGLRVPAIIRYPDRIPAGQVRQQLAHGCDWYPTLAELAGIELPPVKLDGKSLVEMIDNEGAPEVHDVIHWGGERGSWSVRKGDWKLINRPFNRGEKEGKTTTRWLSNLVQDPSEQTNYLQENRAIADMLEQLHSDWVAEIRSER